MQSRGNTAYNRTGYVGRPGTNEQSPTNNFFGGKQPHTSHMSAGPNTSGQLEMYHIGRIIGQGAYAQVRLCLDKRDQMKYAIKVYEKYRLADPMKKKAC